MATMTDQELRALVRQVIDQHLPAETRAAPAPPRAPAIHASHLLLVLEESSGPCLIEPAVGCTHCGYCQSLGH